MEKPFVVKLILLFIFATFEDELEILALHKTHHHHQLQSLEESLSTEAVVNKFEINLSEDLPIVNLYTDSQENFQHTIPTSYPHLNHFDLAVIENYTIRDNRR